MADIQVANTDADLSGNTIVTEENAYTITGLHTFDRNPNPPFAVTSGSAVVPNLDADTVDGVEAAALLRVDGSLALSADWDAGGYEIRSSVFESDVATGTAPLTVASTTLVANLNADKLDSQEGTYYLAAANATGTLAVNQGGTGAVSLTDGGVLLGSGTGAVTAMAALADGEMIVGDGTTDPVAESGATLRTSIGIGTSDSPQFSAIELGHASDTTLARASAGDVNVEGNLMYRAGGTDVPVADGGTGASTLTDGGVLLGSGTDAVTAMAVLADGEMIVGDGTTDPVAESGATLRTSIGVGTGDSPTFTAVTAGQFDVTGEGDLRLQDNTGGQYVGLDAPATVSSSYTLTLPGAVGAVDEVLSLSNVDGTLQWAAMAAGGGKVLQVVVGTYTSEHSTASTSLANTGLTADITPAATANKILVIVNQAGCVAYDSGGGASATGMECYLRRANKTSNLQKFARYCANSEAGTTGGRTLSGIKLDEPNTTSTMTYYTQYSVSAGGDSGSRARVQRSGSVSSITLVEIEG